MPYHPDHYAYDYPELRRAVHREITALTAALTALANAHDERGSPSHAKNVRAERNRLLALLGPDFRETVPDPDDPDA